MKTTVKATKAAEKARLSQNLYNLGHGTKVFFNCSTPEYCREFKIEKVTEKNVSWYTGNPHKGGHGKNVLKMAYTTLRSFNEGIESGAYTILN